MVYSKIFQKYLNGKNFSFIGKKEIIKLTFTFTFKLTPWRVWLRDHFIFFIAYGFLGNLQKYPKICKRINMLFVAAFFLVKWYCRNM